MDCIQLKIFQIDNYLTRPFHVNRILYGPDFYKHSRNSKWKNVKNVTVVRIFGSTPNGIKVCLHVHRHYSHLSVRKKDLFNIYKFNGDQQTDQVLSETFKIDFESELKRLGEKDFEREESLIESVEPYISRSMYGFHEDEETFFKVKFYSHFVCNKAKTLLETGMFHNQFILPYNCLEQGLQFFVDNQIFLNTIEFKKVTLRRTYPFEEDHYSQSESDIFKSIRNHKLRCLPFFPVFNEQNATSSCFLEADVRIDEDIIHSNYPKLFPSNGVFSPKHPGAISMWNEQFQRNKEDYKEMTKVLTNQINRDSIWSDLNLHFGILSSFLNSKIQNEDRQVIESDEIARTSFIESGGASGNNSGGIADSTQTIPQFDGMDDTEVESASKTNNDIRNKQKFHCKKQKVSIELNRLSVLSILKSKYVSINSKLKSRIMTVSKFKTVRNKEKNKLVLTQSAVTRSLNLLSKTKKHPILNIRKKHLIISPLASSELKELKTIPFHSTPQFLGKPPKKLLFGQFSEVINSIRPSNLSNDSKNAPSTSKQILFPAHKNFSFITSQDLKVQYPPNVLGSLSLEQDSFGSTIEALNKTRSHDGLIWHKCADITLMSLEVLVNTREDFLPNPYQDDILAVSFSVFNEYLKDEFVIGNEQQFQYLGLIIVSPNRPENEKIIFSGYKVVHTDYVANEIELFHKLSFYIKNFDPDILLGWTVDTLSWGFLLQRSKVLEIEFMLSISRINDSYLAKGNFEGEKDKPPKLVGRIIMNVWYLMRHEFALKSYTFENVYCQIFHQRVPKYSHRYLRVMWNKPQPNQIALHLVLEYLLCRTIGVIKILGHLDFIRRTFDLSCLFGMKFEDVIGRGTQFRVESMLFPLCQKEKIAPIRFPNQMIIRMAAPECIALNIEPNSALHREPVAVLDFQSLYPSVMIAHNYCYTTCLGRVRNIINSDGTLGCYEFDETRDIFVSKLKPEDVHVSPIGVAFVKPNLRRGVLSKMLEDLLFTRMLIKAEMKRVSKDMDNQDISNKQKLVLKTLQRKLNTCQLGLKLIANVTYGYTSANFSGRMPCVDVADSIVSKGRDILERSIEFVNQWGIRSKTNARVIYGDTDSMFISFPNNTKSQAFEFAFEITNEINRRNPHPITIKVEKVYQPCMLFAKKRYCGYSYESPDQTTPKFDAKGIETVRRDTCDIVSKILEKSIRILFENDGKVDELKPFIQWQISKILNGKINRLNDFVFAKEFSGLNSYKNPSVIPSCRIAQRRILKDPKDVPKYNERIPYVIIDGEPKQRLSDLAREPFDLLLDSKLCLNASYYIQKAIFPPLGRVLQATGLNQHRVSLLTSWYEEIRISLNKQPNKLVMGRRKQLMAWFKQSKCSICNNIIPIDAVICAQCLESSQKTMALVYDRLSKAGHKLYSVSNKCLKCCGASVSQLQNLDVDSMKSQPHVCISLDCQHLPIYYQSMENFKEINKLHLQISPKLCTQIL